MSVKEMQALKKGYFVKETGNVLGTGKIKEIRAGSVVVEFFSSPVSRQDVEIPFESLRPLGRLQPKTRCFVYIEALGRWYAGRVEQFDAASGEYQVKFPEGTLPGNLRMLAVPTEDVYVRWNRPLADAVSMLAETLQETAFLRETRASFVRGLLEQRAMTRGVTGLLSAKVQVVPEQLEAVWELVSGASQRRVLAAPPGWGKTIAAGAVVRQFLLDDPAGKVLLVVPPLLVAFWEEMLRKHFHLQPNDPRLKLIAADRAVTAKDFVLKQRPGLVVFDDAQLVAADVLTKDEAALRRYRFYAAAAQQAERVLLTTPLASQEQEALYWAMFHLVDRDGYPLEQLPEAASLWEKKAEPRLLEVGGSELPLCRQTGKLKVLQVAGEAAEELEETLEQWRLLMKKAMESDADLAQHRQLVEVLYLALAECAGSSYKLLKELVGCRLGRQTPAQLEEELPKTWLHLCRKMPLLEGEEVILQRLDALTPGAAEAEPRLASLAAYIKTLPKARKVVVFTRFAATCQTVTDELSKLLGAKAVAQVHRAQTVREVQAAQVQFRDEASCQVLVLDPRGEEYCDLGHAQVVVHFDLPFDLRRLERRMSRVERRNRTEALQTVAVLGSGGDYSLANVWCEVLEEELSFFRQSLHGVDGWARKVATPLVRKALLEDGYEGLLDAATALEEAFGQWQASRPAAATTAGWGEAALAYDNDSDGQRQAFEPWIAMALGLGRQGPRYTATSETVLMPFDWLSRMQEDLQRPLPYDRSESLQLQEAAAVRSGQSFLDTVSRYLDWDDRGQTFAFWRPEARWSEEKGDEWAGFCYEYTLEADMKLVRGFLKKLGLPERLWKNLRRRADGFLAPLTVRLYLDQQGRRVRHPELLDILEQPFSKARDINLIKGRVKQLHEVIGLEDWKDACGKTYEASLKLLEKDAWYQELVPVACEALEKDTAQRAKAWNEAGRTDLAEQEIALSRALAAGMKKPAVRLLAAGCIIVSGRKP